MNRNWETNTYQGRMEKLMFASSQIWRLIDENRAKCVLKDWSVPSNEIGYGSYQDYLDNKLWLG